MKKTWICILLASFLAMSSCSTSSNSKALTVAYGLPDFSQDEKTVGIDAWIGPKPTDRAIAEYVDCGYDFTHWNAGVSFGKSDTKAEANDSMNETFNLLKKHGVKVILAGTAINMAQTTASRFEIYDQKYSETLEKWKDDDTFYGVMIYDEPTFVLSVTVTGLNDVTLYEDTGEYIRDEYAYFSSKYPGKHFETVLLGAPTKETTESHFSYLRKYPTYADYIGHYYDCVLRYVPYEQRILSMDCYPFTIDRLGKPSRNQLFVQSLADLALEAEKYNVEKKWTYIQSFRQIVNGESILYQYYTAMAFGYKHFVTYHYGSDWDCDSPAIDKAGNKTEMWWYLKNAHDEVRSFENVYMRFADGWKGTIAIEGENRGDYTRTWSDSCPLLEESDRIQSVKAQEDLMIGVMKDEEGFDGYLLSNQALPYGNATNDVEITFKKADKAIVFIDGEQKMVDLIDGKLSLRLSSGGGALVVPIKEA